MENFAGAETNPATILLESQQIRQLFLDTTAGKMTLEEFCLRIDELRYAIGSRAWDQGYAQGRGDLVTEVSKSYKAGYQDGQGDW